MIINHLEPNTVKTAQDCCHWPSLCPTSPPASRCRESVSCGTFFPVARIEASSTLHLRSQLRGRTKANTRSNDHVKAYPTLATTIVSYLFGDNDLSKQSFKHIKLNPPDTSPRCPFLSQHWVQYRALIRSCSANTTALLSSGQGS